jgi:hypothetical protein
MAAHKSAIFIAAILTTLALAAAAACGGSTKNVTSDSSASQASIDQLAARVQQDEMLNGLLTIADLPVHTMDESAQKGTIDNKYVPTARTLVRITALTNWSEPLKADATKLHDDAVTLLKGLDNGDDVSLVKKPSQTVHEDWHLFTDAAWKVVAKDLPPDAGGPKPAPSEQPGGSTTPANPTQMAPHAGATP